MITRMDWGVTFGLMARFSIRLLRIFIRGFGRKGRGRDMVVSFILMDVGMRAIFIVIGRMAMA